MNNTIILLICIISPIITCLIMLFYIHFTLKHFFKSNQYQITDESFDERQLTTYELERLEREENFDKRINQMKEELANQQTILRHGISADELHPLVHNLPHNAIQTKTDLLPDVEYAE